MVSNQLINKQQSTISSLQTQQAISLIKNFFEGQLSQKLNLLRVSCPLFVDSQTGLNDNLNGVELPINFQVASYELGKLEIVHSLAKWKRMALGVYGLSLGQGLYTDMRAIRKDEVLDSTHSLLVDQWDWEKVIDKEERHLGTLKETVESIYDCIYKTEQYINSEYPELSNKLPGHITFITSQELEDMYPELPPDLREHYITYKYGAVFISEIGKKLKSGVSHGGRSPDYDDWTMNGDIVVWNDRLGSSLELSSMGIRVDKDALLNQLKEAGCPERLEYPFHQKLLRNELPSSIGGGIGQSRMFMFLLEKLHIGEVQTSVWPKEIIEECAKQSIKLL